MTSLRTTLRSRRAKALAAGITGVLVAGGISAAAAQVGTPEPSSTPETSLALELDDVNGTADGEETTELLEGSTPIGEASGAGITEIPDTGVEEIDELIDELEREIDETVDGRLPVEELDEDDPDGTGPPPGSFGARVSADARGESDGQPGVDGRQIAAEAQAMGEARRAAGGDDRVEDEAEENETEAEENESEDAETDGDDPDEAPGAAVSARARGGAPGR